LWVETWVGNLEGEVGIRSLKKYKKEIISWWCFWIKSVCLVGFISWEILCWSSFF
jgi:hypothetical protein